MPYSDPNIGEQFIILDRRLTRVERSVMSYVEAPDAQVVANYAISSLQILQQIVRIDNSTVHVYLKLSWSVPLEPDSDPVRLFHMQHSFDAGVTWTQITVNDGPPIEYGPFPPGVSVSVRVRAVSAQSVLGPWATISTTTTTDSTTPDQPSTPTVEAFFGTLVVRWNGLDVQGDPMPADFKSTEIHISTLGPTFTLTSSTLVGSFLYGGSFVLSNLNYGTTYYVRLRAVDWNNNKSPASTAASGTPDRIVNTDLIDDIVNARLLADDAVGSAAIADLAVGTAHIQNLAVVDAKIGNVSANKITSGLIQASQAITIGILNRRRIELTSQAITSYDVVPTITAELDVLTSSGRTPITDPADWISLQGMYKGTNWTGPHPTPTVGNRTDYGVAYQGMRLTWDDTPTTVGADMAAQRLYTDITVAAGDTVEISASVIADLGGLPWHVAVLGYATGEQINPTGHIQSSMTSYTFTQAFTDIRVGIVIDKPAEGWSGVAGQSHLVVQMDVVRYTYDNGSNVEVEVWRLGADNDSNFFSINRPGHADEVLAAISAAGDITGRDVTAARDLSVGENLYIGSEHIDQYLDHRARGVIEWANVATNWTFNHGEMIHYELAAELEAGRLYKLTCFARLDGVAVSDPDPLMRIRATTDGSQPTTSSPEIQLARVQMGSKTSNLDASIVLMYIFPASIDQLWRCAITYSNGLGTDAQAIVADAQYVIEDIGPVIPSRAIARQVSWVSGSTPPADPGEGTSSAKTYTKTWTCAWSGSYSNRAVYNSYYGKKLMQGYYSSTWNVQSSLAGFNLGSTLTGATISKVEVYLYAAHWYYAGGGTAVIRTHEHTSRPSTFSTESPAKRVSFNRGQGKWVDITSIFEANDKGITLDPGATTNREYYGRFHGVGETNPPKLRITYTK